MQTNSGQFHPILLNPRKNPQRFPVLSPIEGQFLGAHCSPHVNVKNEIVPPQAAAAFCMGNVAMFAGRWNQSETLPGGGQAKANTTKIIVTYSTLW